MKRNQHSNSENLINFNKALFGVKEKEVMEYIDLLNNNLNKAHEVYEEKLAEMKSTNELLTYDRNSQEEKLKQLTAAYQKLFEERNALKQTVDNQKNLTEELQNARQEKEQILDRMDSCKQIEEENQQLRKQLAENNVLCQMREQEQAKLLAEIDALKNQNKELTESYLEEKNQLKAEIEEKNLKLTKLLQMHRYTLQQSRSTLDSLVKQFNESCELVSKIQVG